jgi:GntR family transcriptional regulator
LKVDRRASTPEEAEALSLREGCEEIVHISRVIMAEGIPVAYLIDVLPCNLLTPDELGPEFTGSVLDLLLGRGSPSLLSSRTEINAVTASIEVARQLGIQRGDVLLRFSAYLYATTGEVVDYSFSYFLPGYFRFHVVRRVG